LSLAPIQIAALQARAIPWYFLSYATPVASAAGHYRDLWGHTPAFRRGAGRGTCETPEFQRQNREFAAAVETAGKKVRLLVGERPPAHDVGAADLPWRDLESKYSPRRS
jgi:hypothetical protein